MWELDDRLIDTDML